MAKEGGEKSGNEIWDDILQALEKVGDKYIDSDEAKKIIKEIEDDIKLLIQKKTNKEEIPSIINFIFDLLEGAGLLISKYPNEIAYIVGKLLLSVASTEHRQSTYKIACEFIGWLMKTFDFIKDHIPIHQVSKAIVNIQLIFLKLFFGKMPAITPGLPPKDHYSFAVVGPVNMGKTSFINAFLGLRKNDEGAGKVDEGETTTGEPKKYRSPMYKYLEFADMPGWGTKTNLSATYYKEKKLDTYDGVILFVNVLNDSNLLNVAKQLLDHNINMIFVYAKTDLALIDEVRRDGLTDDGESFDFNHPKLEEMQEFLNKWLSQRRNEHKMGLNQEQSGKYKKLADMPVFFISNGALLYQTLKTKNEKTSLNENGNNEEILDRLFYDERELRSELIQIAKEKLGIDAMK